MSKKPRKVRTVRPQKKGKLTSAPTGVFVTREELLNTIGELYQKIMGAVENRVRIAELKAQMEGAKTDEVIDTIKANQIVMQDVVGKKGVYTVEEFQTAFAQYVEEKLGVVEDGKMAGNVFVHFYNVGNTPPATSTISEHVGGGPVFID